MLKLEKSSQRHGITVQLREREHFFEPRLLKALALALVLHLGGLFLVHVTPFSFTSSFIFSPVKVKSDHPARTITAIATSHPSLSEDELIPPAISIIPPLEIAHSPQESSLLPSLTPLNPHAFHALEERLWPIWESRLTLPLEEPRIRMKISGDLAELVMLETNPHLKETIPINNSSKPVYVSYNVQMDETTGELFWVERQKSSGIKSLDQLTEKIIFDLRFAPDPSLIQVTGTVHFVILITEET